MESTPTETTEGFVPLADASAAATQRNLRRRRKKALAPAVLPEIAAAAGLKINEADGSWRVTRSAFGSEVAEEGAIVVRPFVIPPAYLTLEYGFTVQPRPYQPITVKARLTIPCYPGEIDRTYTAMANWLGKRLETERRDIEGFTKIETQRANGRTAQEVGF